MKTLSILSLGLAVGLSAQADLIKFQLSPPGTEAGVGLSPSNTVPPAVTSTGSGGTIAGDITFDPDTRRLFIAVGYGSEAGFTDLTAPSTTTHIHFGGPGTNGNVQIVLDTINHRATNPASGGVIVGTVTVNVEDVTNLLAGLLYLDLHTSNYFSGELRGQLIPMSGAPLVVCPPPAVLECGSSSATLVTLTSDPEGEALSVVWSVNGIAAATNTVPASVPCLPAMTSLTQDFPQGTNIVQVTVTDASGNMVSCSTTITVLDTNPPAIVSASAHPSAIWPPNNKFVDVKVSARVKDTCGATTWKIIAVSSNKPPKGKKPSKDPAWVITGDHTVQLLAVEKAVYTITVQAQDASGNLSSTKKVVVPVDKCGDDGKHGDGDDDRRDGPHR